MFTTLSTWQWSLVLGPLVMVYKSYTSTPHQLHSLHSLSAITSWSYYPKQQVRTVRLFGSHGLTTSNTYLHFQPERRPPNREFQSTSRFSVVIALIASTTSDSIGLLPLWLVFVRVNQPKTLCVHFNYLIRNSPSNMCSLSSYHDGNSIAPSTPHSGAHARGHAIYFARDERFS